MPVKRRLQELSPSQRTILDLLRNHEGSSRAELAVLAGLSPAALTRQIKELLDLGLVMEGARRSGLRGQPALPLSLRPEAAYSIGLAFSLHEIEVVGIDFRGIRVARLSRPLRCHGATALTRQCSAMVRELEGMLPRRPVIGVGIALPGYFRPGRPIVMETFDALVELAGVDLDIFLSAFERPTWVENNSTAAALAEYYSRTDHRVRHLALVNVGYGFSAGFVIDGKLYRGRHGNAGEIGRLYPRGTPRPSALDLVETLRASGTRIAGGADIDAALERADPRLDAWIERAGDQLHHAISLLDCTLAPDEIVLGGQIPAPLAARLGDAVSHLRAQQGRDTRFRVSPLGPLASALGAAFLPIYRTSSPRLGQSPSPRG